MIPRRRTTRAALAGLCLFAVWQAWELARFIASDTRPPAWDQANHLFVAWRYFQAASLGLWGEIWRYTPNAAIPPFPPIYHLLLATAYLFPNPAGAALWVNWFYLCALAFSLCGLARECRRDGAAVAAAIAFACAPLVAELTRTSLVDLPLTAVAAAAWWALVSCDGFRRRGPSLAFGLAFGVGMLHKWSFFSYLLPAFWLGLRALRRRETRANALASGALGLALCLPWYLIRLPLVLMRLTQATNDFVVPFWKGAAFLHYLGGMPADFGALFCAMSAYSLWALRRDRNPATRLVLLGTLSSYIFWAIVPNRQMRYLLPGLTGLAALIAAAAPPPLVWALAAWQATMSIARPPAPPAVEDWKLSAALEAVAAARRPGLTAVAVIANDARFNKLNLTWQAALLGVGDLELRGVNDVPWELSEFVLYKRGGMGPGAVVGEFRGAEASILDKAGWFTIAFEEKKYWPLPDATTAVLYGRRRLAAAPFRGRAFSGPLRFSSLIETPAAELAFGAWNGKKASYDRVTVSVKDARLKGLAISGARLELVDAVFVPDGPGARLVSTGRVKIVSAHIEAAALASFLTRGPLKIRSVEFEGVARMAASLKGVPVSGEVAVSSSCAVSLTSLRAGGIPLPPQLLLRYGANGPLFDLESLADRTTVRTVFGLSRSVPFPVDIPSCSVRDGRLSIP